MTGDLKRRTEFDGGGGTNTGWSTSLRSETLTNEPREFFSPLR